MAMHTFTNIIFILYVLVFCLHVHLCEGVGSSGTGIVDSFELSCGWWKLNLRPLEEQPVLLSTESSLQPQAVHTCECPLSVYVLASSGNSSQTDSRLWPTLRIALRSVGVIPVSL